MDKLIGPIIGLVIVVSIFDWISKNGYWIWIFGTLGLIIFVVIAININGSLNEAKKRALELKQKELKEAEKIERRRLAGIKKKEEKQNRLLAAANEIEADSLRIIESLPDNISFAEKSIGRAEAEYKEGAFAPFWDEVENAINSLAHFNNGLMAIKDNSIEYKKTSEKIEDKNIVMSLPAVTLPDPDIAVRRMKLIVREAQKNFQFATIYEQRKTNKILVSGFTNLAYAINNMAERIEYSVDELKNAMKVSFGEQNTLIADGLSNVSESIDNNSDLIKSGNELIRDGNEISKEAGLVRKQHGEDELKMLDNIQRKRRPTSEGTPSLRDDNYK